MTPDVSYTPKRQNNLPLIVISACVAVMILCAVFLMLNLGNKLAFQTLFVIATAVTIFFFVRYLSVSYTYTVSEEQGTFTVTQKKGRRVAVLCSMELSALYRVRPYDVQDEVERHRPDRYAYCVSLRPKVSCLLFFDDGDHIVSVRIEADKYFYHLLTRIAEQNSYLPPSPEDPEDEQTPQEESTPREP
jgi:hypothetical protein